MIGRIHNVAWHLRNKSYPRPSVSPLRSPHPAHSGASVSWALVSGSCASPKYWQHQLGWKGAELSSRFDGPGSKRVHGGCSGSCRRFQHGGFVLVEVASWRGRVMPAPIRGDVSGVGRRPAGGGQATKAASPSSTHGPAAPLPESCRRHALKREITLDLRASGATSAL